jgi:acetyl esterase/lipase
LWKMKIKTVYFLLLLFAVSTSVRGQKQVIPVWQGTAPGSENWTQNEIQYLNDQNQQMVRNVVTPTLTIYLPDHAKATGTAVIVAPGGGFRFLSWQTEGTEVADYLAGKGVTVFLLKYRLMNTGASPEELQKSMVALFLEIGAATNPENKGKPAGNLLSNKEMNEACTLAQEDGRQAIRLIRNRSSEWGIKPDHIGILGFSAGGMITLGTALQFDKESRPDFVAAIYTPWIERDVPANAPPVFVLVAGDDNLASPGSIQTYNSWKAVGKDAELHIYSKGGHGFGMQKKGFPADSWIDRFVDWMKVHNLL